MIFIFDQKGNSKATVKSGNLHQGSNLADEIIVLAPIAPSSRTDCISIPPSRRTEKTRSRLKSLRRTKSCAIPLALFTVLFAFSSPLR